MKKMPPPPVLSKRPTKPHPEGQNIHIIIEMVASAMGVTARSILSEGRSTAKVSRARHVAMYLANVVWQWPLHRVGKAFDRDRTTIGYACRLIEDRRDDRDFDALMERLEACLKTLPRAEASTPPEIKSAGYAPLQQAA